MDEFIFIAPKDCGTSTISDTDFYLRLKLNDFLLLHDLLGALYLDVFEFVLALISLPDGIGDLRLDSIEDVLLQLVALLQLVINLVRDDEE